VRVEGAAIWRNGTLLAEGTVLEADELEEALVAQQSRVAHALARFAENTLEHLREEAGVLSAGIDLPSLETRFRDKHVLVVARGPGYKSDLRMVRPYVREFRPVLVAVDGGADALHEVGLRADVIVGDFDSVSTKVLLSGAELVVHAYRDGRAPGLERVQQLGRTAVLFPAIGTSEDIAMLLADDKGADLIVAVGTHATLVEFLDKGRSGMASTFLTRLRVGSKLVDAKGVSRLYRSRISTPSLLLLVATTLITMGVAIVVSPVGKIWLDSVRDVWSGFIFWLVGLFS
jgi:uncharacterized membrane-anchored protein